MAFRHRFLIDECLSPKLADLGGDVATITHVNFRGMIGRSDDDVAAWCVANDHVMVTNNARDFRRIYTSIDLHPGLVILVPTLGRPEQLGVMAAALPGFAARRDLVNTLTEIMQDGITITDFPPP